MNILIYRFRNVDTIKCFLSKHSTEVNVLELKSCEISLHVYIIIWGNEPQVAQAADLVTLTLREHKYLVVAQLLLKYKP